MEQVAILTESQKDELVGQLFAPASYFNPIQDCNGEWVISSEEIDQSIYPQYDWIKALPLIDWCGPYIPISGTT